MANRSSTDTNIDRRGKDMMGYPLKRQLKDYTDLDIEAARVLAKEAGYEWDCVYTDPAVTGKRFLKSAKIVRQFLEDQAMLCAAQDAHGRVPVVTTGLEYDPNSASGYRAPPAVAQASVDAIRQTIADEWGSHLCYRHPDGLRHCDGDKRCRCVDIARAIVSEHGDAQAVPGSREATLKMVANLFAESVHETYTREEVVSLIEDMIRALHKLPHDMKVSCPEVERVRGVAQTPSLCSCKASQRDGQHMAWCPSLRGVAQTPSDELQSVYDALCQAQDCIRGETPEDVTDAEAREDTIDKVRDAMRTVEAIQSRGAAQAPSEPVAYRVKDYADGWILCHTLEVAEHEADGQCLIQPLYLGVAQTAPPPKCTCGYWRAARISHANDCPALAFPQPSQ
jgi:hypothetical protein